MADPEPLLKTVGWFGETWGYWVQTVAFLLSGLAAAGALIFNALQLRMLRLQMRITEAHGTQQSTLLREQLQSQERQSRHRATVEVVRHEQTDRELVEAFKRYAELRETPGALTQLAITHPQPTPDNGLIMRVLNNYEYVSVGIHTGAFDEEMYARMKRSNFIRDWDALKPYVCELRMKYKKDRIFIEFEGLAEKWRRQ